MKRVIIVELFLLAYVSLNITIVKDKPEPIKLTMIGTSEIKEKNKPVVRTYKLTHYGADCDACSGITASGIDVRSSIYYNDNQYEAVRIVAMSKSMPMYSIIRIHNYYGNTITAIVLDRGVGNGVIDLLTESEAKSSQLGIQHVNIEVLRYGR